MSKLCVSFFKSTNNLNNLNCFDVFSNKFPYKILLPSHLNLYIIISVILLLSMLMMSKQESERWNFVY